MDSLARQEQRTKSDLLDEMVEIYRKHRHHIDWDDLDQVEKFLRDAQAEGPMTPEQFKAEWDGLAADTARQGLAQKIEVEDAVRIVHEYRREKRANGRF